ncbi:MAG TPA: M55 family metallopeptidase, partial [Nitriliruptorales bacterium]
MHVYISIDMEGIAGIATRNQVIRGSDDYPRGRSLMTSEANAAIAGAFDGGATHVTVNDSHGDMSNLLPDELDERAELIIGSPKAASMVEGIDAPADVALFVGYHAAAGVEGGVLAHTYSSAVFADVRLNGASITEAELNAHVAAVHGVPVGLVTGDDHVCRVAADRLPGVRTVEVKR